jgi:hypothetical protein
MAWAALIPVAMKLLQGNDDKPQQGPALPPPPTLGEIFKSNTVETSPHTFPMTDMIKAGPVGGGMRGR